MNKQNFLKKELTGHLHIKVNDLMNKYNEITTEKQLEKIIKEVVSFKYGTYKTYNLINFFDDNEVADRFTARAIRNDFRLWVVKDNNNE